MSSANESTETTTHDKAEIQHKMNPVLLASSSPSSLLDLTYHFTIQLFRKTIIGTVVGQDAENKTLPFLQQDCFLEGKWRLFPRKLKIPQNPTEIEAVELNLHTRTS